MEISVEGGAGGCEVLEFGNLGRGVGLKGSRKSS